MYLPRSACYQRFRSFVAVATAVAQIGFRSVVAGKIRTDRRVATCSAALAGLMMKKWTAAEVEMYWC